MSDDLSGDDLRELYELAPCGHVLTLPDGTFARVNQTFLAWTGYARDELIPARRFQDLLTVPGKLFYENQFAPLLRMQGFVNEVTFDLVRPGGDRLPVLLNAVQPTDADGRPRLIASAIFAATRRRTYEQELLSARRKAEQLASIVSLSSDAIVSLSADGAVETWNAGAERMFGYQAREIVGRSIRELLAPSDAQQWDELSGQLQAGQAVQRELSGVHADGRGIELSVGLTPHTGLLGELSAVSLVIRDITERKALEQLQREFMTMVAHELRNPVGAIRGYAQLMRRRGTYSESAVDTIMAQADHLTRLIDDLLMASRIESNRLDLRLADLDLVEEVHAAAEHRRAERSTIRVEAPPGPISVLADRQRLGQVLANLLTNAVKYSPPDSEILVRVTHTADEAAVAVVDRGAGIPRDALPHLFDRFYRVPGSAQKAQGLGLGLYITRQLVESHGGRIDVASETGRGSTFIVTLPLHVGSVVARNG